MTRSKPKPETSAGPGLSQGPPWEQVRANDLHRTKPKPATSTAQNQASNLSRRGQANKSLKENQENAIRQMKKKIQDLRTKTETIKKTQTKVILEMENLGKQSRPQMPA